MTIALDSTRRSAGEWLSVAGALFASLAFLVCEEVIWTGQPGGDADGATVLAYYGGHAAAVEAGDALWILAVVGLCLAAAPLMRSTDGMVRLLAGGLLFVAALLLAASASTAFALAFGASGGGWTAAGALDAWRMEGGLFAAGRVALAVAVLCVAAWLAVRRTPLGWAVAIVGVVLAAGNLLDVLGQPAFLVTPLWLAAAGLWSATTRRR